MATINGDASDNNLSGTGSPDEITGDAGDDTITGGGGGDLIDGGGGSLAPTALDLNWTAQGGNGANLAGGFTQNTGGIEVTVNLTDDGGGTTAEVSTATTYVGTGEGFDPNSNLAISGDGSSDVWTIDIDFAAATGSGFDDSVQNVSFRLQDIDAGGWQDIFTVNAYDEDGNPVEVILTPEGGDTVSGNTVTAGSGATGASDPEGSVLVTIAGPVARIEIIYENGGTTSQLALITDVEFEAVPTDDDVLSGEGGADTIYGDIGDDSIDGGSGADSLMGESGNDTLIGGGGTDTLDGGAGSDSLFGGSGFDVLTGGAGNDTLDGGNGNDTIFANGGDVVIGGEGGTDTADELVVDDVAEVIFDPMNSENGTIVFNDGSTATFTGIEILTVNGGPDGVVEGTAGNDLIDGDYVDEHLEQVDNDDGTAGTTGDQDIIEAGAGNDTVYGGADNDSISGGPDASLSADEILSWVAEGDGTDVSGGFTQDTGLANITVSVTNDGAMDQADISSTTQYVGSDPFANDSALLIGGDGGPDVATVDITSDVPLTDISFRLNDVDSNSWEDILTVNAYDADNNPVTVVLTADGNETVARPNRHGRRWQRQRKRNRRLGPCDNCRAGHPYRDHL